MSASPEHRDAEWAARLPAIPDSTGVFWPSVWTGLALTLWGLYLIMTPSAGPSEAPLRPGTPAALSLSPSPRVLLGDSKVLRLGFVDSRESTFAAALEEFARLVATRSQGELQIELLPGGLVDGVQMDERTLVEAVRQGKLALGLSTTSPLTNYNHLLDLFDLPFLFRDPDHADRVLEGPVGEQLLSCLQDKDLQGLGYLEVGFRLFSSSVPLPNYAAFTGKKLRVMQSVTFTRFVKAIGGDPVPSPVDKIYLMGKEGYIDGADRTYPTYWDFRLYDVHRYITETHHAYSVKMILINDPIFDAMPAQHRAILREAAKEASLLQRQKQREADEAVKEMAVQEGITIFELAPEDRRKFLEASKDLHEEYRRNQSAELLDAILKTNQDQ